MTCTTFTKLFIVCLLSLSELKLAVHQSSQFSNHVQMDRQNVLETVTIGLKIARSIRFIVVLQCHGQIWVLKIQKYFYAIKSSSP